MVEEAGIGMGMWEASEVLMFISSPGWCLFYNKLLKCTFPSYTVICVVAVFQDESSPSPLRIQRHAGIAPIHNENKTSRGFTLHLE